MNVLSKAQVQEAAQSPTWCADYLADLLVSHETLRGMLAETRQTVADHNLATPNTRDRLLLANIDEALA